MIGPRGRRPVGLDAGRIRLLRVAGAASLAVAFTLVGLKTWGVLVTGSVALLGSLADSALDLVASSITFVALRVAVEPPDREHRFGHGKSEAIAGLAQSIIITGSALYVGARAVQRLVEPEPLAAPALGTGVMLGSLALTTALIAVQRYVVRRTGSLAVSADSVHYGADLLTGLAVLAALGVSGYGGWPYADPLLGLAIAAVILVSVKQIAGSSIDVLLDRELPDAARERIEAIAAERAGVRRVAAVRTRSAGATQFVELSVQVDPDISITSANAIALDVERSIGAEFPSAEILVQVGPAEGAGAAEP